jgi:hypothetical protein
MIRQFETFSYKLISWCKYRNEENITTLTRQLLNVFYIYYFHILHNF